MPEPWNSDTLTRPQVVNATTDRIDPSNDLVAGNDGNLRVSEFPINDMEVRAANPTSVHAHSDFTRTGQPIITFYPF